MESPGWRQSPRAKLGVTVSMIVLVASSAAYIAYSAVTGSNGSAPTTARHAGHARTRPNVVLIVTDDQRWNTLWAMPDVRRDLVANGVTFTNAFVTTSLCCPSRASILTGQYSRHTGVYNDAGPHGGAPAFTDASTLATWLHGAGYRTALVGKYLNNYNRMAHHEPPGWSEWDAIASPSPALHFYDYKLNEDGHIVRYGNSPGDYVDTVLGKIGLRFISDRALAVLPRVLPDRSAHARHARSPGSRAIQEFPPARTAPTSTRQMSRTSRGRGCLSSTARRIRA